MPDSILSKDNVINGAIVTGMTAGGAGLGYACAVNAATTVATQAGAAAGGAAALAALAAGATEAAAIAASTAASEAACASAYAAAFAWGPVGIGAALGLGAGVGAVYMLNKSKNEEIDRIRASLVQQVNAMTIQATARVRIDNVQDEAEKFSKKAKKLVQKNISNIDDIMKLEIEKNNLISLKDDIEDSEDSFQCGIRQVLSSNTVTPGDSHLYDRNSLLEWYNQQRNAGLVATSPFTQQLLPPPAQWQSLPRVSQLGEVLSDINGKIELINERLTLLKQGQQAEATITPQASIPSNPKSSAPSLRLFSPATSLQAANAPLNEEHKEKLSPQEYFRR